MKNTSWNIISSDKPTLIAMIISVILLILILTLLTYINVFERKNNTLKIQLNEMRLLKDELLNVKNIVETQEKKIDITKVNSVVSAIEQTLQDIGIKATAIKPLEKKKMEGFHQEDAELTVENIDLNKIVNLLYKIENSPLPIKIKNVALRTTFENPNMFILNITASLISKT
ncbi:MAG: hypothetical protein HY752_03740 [Nitrospirae bacterium]|nr:hypothetical protein [Nitrospirota bacterium]